MAGCQDLVVRNEDGATPHRIRLPPESLFGTEALVLAVARADEPYVHRARVIDVRVVDEREDAVGRLFLSGSSLVVLRAVVIARDDGLSR